MANRISHVGTTFTNVGVENKVTLYRGNTVVRASDTDTLGSIRFPLTLPPRGTPLPLGLGEQPGYLGEPLLDPYAHRVALCFRATLGRRPRAATSGATQMTSKARLVCRHPRLQLGKGLWPADRKSVV